jgi:hypothetical protein
LRLLAELKRDNTGSDTAAAVINEGFSPELVIRGSTGPVRSRA